MKKFTKIKEQYDSLKSYEAKVTLTVIVQAGSESQASLEVSKILSKVRAVDRYITDADVVTIEQTDVNFPEFANENALCVTNTQKMMADYLQNKGATKTDSHYVNLEKMYKIFQVGTTINKPAVKTMESKADVDTEQMTTDLAEIKADELEDSIKAVELMIKEFKAKEGDTNNQQFANLEDMKKTLIGYRKLAKK